MLLLFLLPTVGFAAGALVSDRARDLRVCCWRDGAWQHVRMEDVR